MRFLVVIFLSLLALTGCSSLPPSLGNLKIPTLKLPDWSLFGGKKPAPTTSDTITATNCPSVSIVPDLNRMVEFQGQKWVSEIRFTAVTRQCQIMGNMVKVMVTMTAEGRLGPQGEKDAKIQANYSYPYLMAVIDPTGKILSKDVFALNTVYQKSNTPQNPRVFYESLTQAIPAPNGQIPAGTHIQIGFLLSPEELAYNRQNK
jgi:hypothetical protein